MKKPNITKGEWEYVAPSVVGIKNSEIDIAYIFGNKSDLYAISAVPDMIDALITAYYDIKPEVDSWGERQEQHMKYATLMEIKEALIKSGCEL